ncbi:MAG: Gx transporter family protein [Ruminococcus sp.]
MSGHKNNKVKMKPSVRLMTATAMLTAVSVVLSFLENLLPDLPFAVPGMKLGLSNIAVMFALELYPLPCSLFITAVKALFALVTRGAVAGLMSFAGGFFATLAMWLVIHSGRLTFGAWGVGVSGAFFHNMGQLLGAFFLVSDAVWGYIPVLSALSLLTGTVTGLAFYLLMPVLRKVPVF